MTDLVSYERDGDIATITMDDGKVNALSPAMLGAVLGALDRAEQDEAIVILTGRPGCFSAGFDLKVIREGGDGRLAMLHRHATLALRLLTFPAPVVAACTGHAYPAGAFLLLSSDVRVGADGPFKIGCNEVRIGLPLPPHLLAIGRYRLSPPYFDRTVVTGAMFGPAEAATAGFLDRVVAPEGVAAAAREAAEDLRPVDRIAQAMTKARARDSVIATVRNALATYPTPRFTDA